jgi:NhaA family Na+:H+ antiporter
MLLATATALIWANTAGHSYASIRRTTFGPSTLHLDLNLATWAADGLLAIFFLTAGLELKRELVVGSLRRPVQAMLPIVAAGCGVLGPIGVYVLVNAVGNGTMDGWAVPIATDIAFALAVLAVIGSALPTVLRVFLLTLAIVDDLLGIVIIAVAFSAQLMIWPLLAAGGILVVFYVLQRRDASAWWMSVPLFLVCWALMHASGVHATVAGVGFGLLTRAHSRPGECTTPAERVEHRLEPFSALLCVPVFALLTAGIAISTDSFREVFSQPVSLGIVLGLVGGKIIGIFSGTYLTVRFSRAALSPHLTWGDILALSALGGIGFTVSLLIGELAFDDARATESATTAVLIGSVISALIATLILIRRNAVYRSASREESAM